MMVDPVMGDGGKLYPAYDGVFADAMRVFCGGADIVTPNVTEACLLSGVPYAGDGYSREYMEEILGGIRALHCASAAITGVRFGEGEIGVVYEDFVSGARATVAAPRSDAPLHGTGDVFASALAGYLLAGFSPKKAVSHAVSFVSACIRDTEEEIGEHWYGVKFEGRLGMIADRVKEKQIADMLAQGRDGNDSL